MSSAAAAEDVEGASNDECCMCGQEWTEGEKGWVLCDSTSCENTVCASCTQNLGLIVSDLSYCPPCSGSGQSAAATVGGAVATAVAACAELERLPLSMKAVEKILTNLSKAPEDPKYRKLRLENKAVKKYIDLEPVLRILTSIGFVRREEERRGSAVADKGHSSESHPMPPVEQVLILEGSVDVGQIKELIKILDGLMPENSANYVDGNDKDTRDKANAEGSTRQSESCNSPKPNSDQGSSQEGSSQDGGKRTPTTAADIDEPEAKKRKGET